MGGAAASQDAVYDFNLDRSAPYVTPETQATTSEVGPSIRAGNLLATDRAAHRGATDQAYYAMLAVEDSAFGPAPGHTDPAALVRDFTRQDWEVPSDN